MNHKENRVFKFALSIVCLLVLTLGQATAGPIITEPTSLSPGDSYRLAFLTSGTIDATSTDIGVYNMFVDGFGDTNVIASDWRAIGSTSSVDARDNTGTNPNDGVGVPIFKLNDELLAADNLGLWAGNISLAVAVWPPGLGLDYTDAGEVWDENVWTGANWWGGKSLSFYLGSLQSDPPSTLPLVVHGISHQTDQRWIDHAFIGGTSSLAGAGFLPMYALSDVLVMPGAVIPEPSSLMLLGIGAVGLLGYRLRRKRRLSSATS